MRRTTILTILFSLLILHSGMMRNSYAQIRETDSVRIHKETKNSDPGVFYCYPHGIELIGRDINYVPRLIPLKEGDSEYEPLKMYVPFIDSAMTVELDCELFFDGDLSDTAKMIKPIYIHVFNLHDETGVVASQLSLIDSLEQQPFQKILLWYELTEKFINWLYAQPYSDYYNRGNREITFRRYEPVEGMSLQFEIELYPENPSEDSN